MRRPGDLVGGRYEVACELAPRPLCRRYSALDREVGVQVLLEIYDTELLPDEGAQRETLTALGRARALQHPHLVRVHELLIDEGALVLVLQRLPGESLAAELASMRKAGRSPLCSLEELRTLAEPLVAAVAHAHAHGLVLLALEPDAVLRVESSGDLKLTCVGAMLALPRRPVLEALRTTELYGRLAPEFKAGDTVDGRADVFGLATLCCELLTGVPSPEFAELPAELASVLERARQSDPLCRQTTIEAFGAELGGRAPAARLAPMRGRRAEPEGLADADPEAPTRQVDAAELRRLHGRDVTRAADRDEIFPLRVQSSDTREVDSAMIVPAHEQEGEEELDLDGAVAAEEEEIDTARRQLVDAPLPVRAAPSGAVEVPKRVTPQPPVDPAASVEVHELLIRSEARPSTQTLVVRPLAASGAPKRSRLGPLLFALLFALLAGLGLSAAYRAHEGHVAAERLQKEQLMEKLRARTDALRSAESHPTSEPVLAAPPTAGRPAP